MDWLFYLKIKINLLQLRVLEKKLKSYSDLVGFYIFYDWKQRDDGKTNYYK